MVATRKQRIQRKCFAGCARAWANLPALCEDAIDCDGTAAKESVQDAHDEAGVMSSAYDFFMACCLQLCDQYGNLVGDPGACYPCEENYEELTPDPENPEASYPCDIFNLSVTGGVPPFVWVIVSGGCIGLISNETKTASIVVDSIGCCDVIIWVTDKCGNSCEMVLSVIGGSALQTCFVYVQLSILGILSSNNATRRLRLVQDIADPITGENFTVIGTSVSIDSVGAAKIQILKDVDCDEPIYLELQDCDDCGFFTDKSKLFWYFTDWIDDPEDPDDRPEWVCNNGDETSWTPGDEVADIMAFDHRLNSVNWKRFADNGAGGDGDTTPVNLRLKAMALFVDAENTEQFGWKVNFQGIKNIQYSEAQLFGCFDFMCDGGSGQVSVSDSDRQLFITYDPDQKISIIEPPCDVLAATYGKFCLNWDFRLTYCTSKGTGERIYINVPCKKHFWWLDIINVDSGSTVYQPFIKSDIHGNNLSFPNISRTTGKRGTALWQWIIYYEGTKPEHQGGPGDPPICPECAACTPSTIPYMGEPPWGDGQSGREPCDATVTKTHSMVDVEEDDI